MANKQKSNVDVWLERETKHNREAFENASRYFDGNDALTVNTLEAIYGQESSFGVNSKLGKRNSSGAAGHFRLEKATVKEYNLTVSKNNDQRFDIDYSASAAARYLKNLDNIFNKVTVLTRGVSSIPVKSASERKKFILGAYNGGQGRIARAQYLTERGGKNPQLWDEVKGFPEKAGATKNKVKEICDYVENVLAYESEFMQKSPANKNAKNREGKKSGIRCTQGHWVTIDDRPVFICD